MAAMTVTILSPLWALIPGLRWLLIFGGWIASQIYFYTGLRKLRKAFHVSSIWWGLSIVLPLQEFIMFYILKRDKEIYNGRS